MHAHALTHNDGSSSNFQIREQVKFYTIIWLKQPPCPTRVNTNLRFPPTFIVARKAFAAAALTIIKLSQQMKPR